MIEEYESILKNDVWEVVSRPQGKSVVTSKWLYKIKHAAPKGTFRESKKPDKYSSLIPQLTLVIDSKPSTFEEASKHKV
jgi:hypothetical protein